MRELLQSASCCRARVAAERELLQTFVNTLLSAEADAVCAGYGERTRERVNQRNGYRHRDFDTRAGTVDVAIPKVRAGTYFHDWLLERRTRAVKALTSVVATCYLLGVSTPRMNKLVQSLVITGLSKSQVSVISAEPDAHVEDFRTRSLAEAGPFTFVAADALVLKVREGGRVVPVHALVATGIKADGHRGSSASKSPAGRTAPGDAHTGLVAAIAATLPGAAWLRCRTHYAANLMSAIPKSSWGWVKALLHSVHNQPDTEPVHAQFDRILDALDGKLPAVAEHLEHARPDILAFTAFPYEVWRQIWSNNDREVEPRDPSAYRRGRDLPRPARDHPPGRRRPGRTTRRMGRRPPLPRTRPPRQVPRRYRTRHRHHQRGGA